MRDLSRHERLKAEAAYMRYPYCLTISVKITVCNVKHNFDQLNAAQVRRHFDTFVAKSVVKQQTSSR